MRKHCCRLALVLCFFSSLSAQTQSAEKQDPVKEKLADFEKRLQELEKRKPAGKEASSDEKEMTVEITELRRQLDVLAEEIEKLRSGEEEVAVSPEKARSLGLGPSASSIYRKKRGVSIAGYGEMLYENFDSRTEANIDTDTPSRLDFLRAVFYAGYRFSDKFVFNSEVELEHTDEISLEFAYLDYLHNEQFNVRAGLVLVPMGLVNEFHEPNVFLGARRPETEVRIIPTTWRENGVGVFGNAGKFNYRVFLLNGFDAEGFSSSGLRGGRQKGAEALASDVAVVGRLDFHPTPGVFVGGSMYVGESGQQQFHLNGHELGIRTTIGEVHGQAQWKGVDLRGLYARAVVNGAGDLNLLTRSNVAEAMEGGYFQLGYNLLARSSDNVRLTPFYRFEDVDTQDRLAPGFAREGSQDGTFHTFGFEFRPLYNIVVKSDYQWISNAGKSGLNRFNLGLGYSF